MLSCLESGKGVPVVLVHGNFACKEWWREVLQNPPEGTWLLAPDLPGFGESQAPRDFTPSIPAYAEALRAFLREKDAEEAILVGHSLGGAVVMEAAGEKTRGLVLINPAPPSGLQTPEAYYPILEGYRHNREALAQALAAWRLERAYPGPVLVVYGTLDSLVTRVMAEETAAFFPRGRLLVLEGVGHSVNLESPELLKDILKDFVKEVYGEVQGRG
ncbi:alpha/beta fold hydrolase [Thermus antranikianii]|uniref:alpha/beta fold hydrolase n=1 Tax=Thermus antranikianii TaxID=88190 RepID=UPI001C758286|nr:alpha/beta hydrolase [Thermus antranikianii]QWK21273.1 MAG: alpha/beta hydrolase [Thermus antranikianii]